MEFRYELCFKPKIYYIPSSKENPINQCYYDVISDKLIIESTESRIESFRKFMTSYVLDIKCLSSYYKYTIISCKEGTFIKYTSYDYIYLVSFELNLIYNYPKNSVSVSNDSKRCLILKYRKLYFHEMDKSKEINIKDINISTKFYVTWNNNSNFIALYQKGFDIYIINPRKGNIQHILEKTLNSFCCTFNFNSNYIFVGYKKCIKVFNSSTGKIFSTNRFSGIMKQSFFMSPIDNRYIICIETDDGIYLKLYNIHGEELSNFAIKSGIKYGSWSKDSSKLAISFELDSNDISIYEVGMNHIFILYTFQSCLDIQSIYWSLDSTDLYYICSNTKLHEARLVVFHYAKMNDYIDNILSKPNLVFLEELPYHHLLILNHPHVQESLQYFREGI
jgi:hypothetical protein